MNSNNKNAVEQGALLLARTPKPADLPVEVIAEQKSLLGAINLCMTISGLEDKEIYLALEIDAGHFSNIRKGKGHFPTDKIEALMDLCGNEIPMIWLSHRRGFGLVLLKSEAERRAEEAERRAEKAEEKARIYEDLLRGRAA